MNKPTPTPALEDSICEAVNLIHQFRDELVSYLDGTKQQMTSAELRNARAVGITMQCDSTADRLLAAFYGQTRKETAP